MLQNEPTQCGYWSDCSDECLYKIISYLHLVYKHTQCCPFQIKEKTTHKYCKVAKYKEKKLLLVLAILKKEI